MEKRLDKKFSKRESDVSMLNTQKEVLDERFDNHETRLYTLEMPFRRQRALMRQLSEPSCYMPMLAEEDEEEDTEQYKYFKWSIPREALEKSTDEALDRGLVTSIEIGSMPNIRSLTSIKITLNNGHEDF